MSDSKPEIWMPFYGQDFDRDTKGWSRADRWSYWAALWSYWCGECRGLLDDDEMLMRLCECTSIAWASCKQLIFGPKFTLDEKGVWHQKRAKELYDDAVKTMELASGRGKAGANARWSKCSSNAQAMPAHSQQPCLSNGSSPSPSPSPVPSPTPPPSEPVGGNGVLPQFQLFWDAYPKKSKRNDAEHAFAEVGAFMHITKILEAIAYQKGTPDWHKKQGAYIPMPGNWLRERRWEDRLEVPGGDDPYMKEVRRMARGCL